MADCADCVPCHSMYAIRHYSFSVANLKGFDMYAHENIQVWNHGLKDERIIYTGHDEVFETQRAAQESADNLKAEFGVTLDVYPYVEENWWDNPDNL